MGMAECGAELRCSSSLHKLVWTSPDTPLRLVKWGNDTRSSSGRSFCGKSPAGIRNSAGLQGNCDDKMYVRFSSPQHWRVMGGGRGREEIGSWRKKTEHKDPAGEHTWEWRQEDQELEASLDSVRSCVKKRGWWDGFVDKGTSCACRWPEFRSQPLSGVSQLFIAHTPTFTESKPWKWILKV